MNHISLKNRDQIATAYLFIRSGDANEITPALAVVTGLHEELGDYADADAVITPGEPDVEFDAREASTMKSSYFRAEVRLGDVVSSDEKAWQTAHAGYCAESGEITVRLYEVDPMNEIVGEERCFGEAEFGNANDDRVGTTVSPLPTVSALQYATYCFGDYEPLSDEEETAFQAMMNETIEESQRVQMLS